MNVIILCAGYATRLYPLTKDKPKPLLPIHDRPIIEYIIEKIAKFDNVESIYCITNDKFYSKFADWQSGFSCGKPVEIINDHSTSDEDKLGAIGDLDYAIREKNITTETLVIAGDNLFDFELDGYMEFGKEKKAHALVGAYDVQNQELAKQYGILDINAEGKVESFVEKPENPPSTFASMAIYLFSEEGVQLISEYLAQGLNKDQPGHYIRWLAENYGINGYVFRGNWFDIGDIDSYHKADEFYRAKNS